MSQSRGRPSEQIEKVTKYIQLCKEIPSKPELGWQSKFYFDEKISKNGAYKVEHTPPKGHRFKSPKIEQRAYGKMPVVMVFKTSNRSNTKTKIKVFNQSIDYIISSKKLPGVPEKAEIVELGVGKSFISKYKKKYNLT